MNLNKKLFLIDNNDFKKGKKKRKTNKKSIIKS